jgi:mannose-6-phosphate isomerase-like protein (cupin superfamily)
MKAKRKVVTVRPNYHVKRVEPVMVGSDMQARLFTLAPQDEIPWHCHSECADHYFVLEGALTIMTRKLKREKTVRVGNRYRIAPGTPHVISNRSGADCRFLLLQGIGKRDWINAGNR